MLNKGSNPLSATKHCGSEKRLTRLAHNQKIVGSTPTPATKLGETPVCTLIVSNTQNRTLESEKDTKLINFNRSTCYRD